MFNILLPPNEIIVLDIAGSHARVGCARLGCSVLEKIKALASLGFVPDGDQMVMQIGDDRSRVLLVQALIGIGALFVGGKNWSPSEIVDLFREQGKIFTGYRMITWKRQNEYKIIGR